MKKTFLLILAALTMFRFAAVNCTPEDPDKQKEEQTGPLKAITIDVEIIDEWVFEKRPVFPIHVNNPNKSAIKDNLKFLIFTDMGQQISSEDLDVEIPAKGMDIRLTTSADLTPGFYKVAIYIGRVCRTFNFGIDPFDIVSEPDKQDDFNTFWESAKDQLKAIDMDPELTEITSMSTSARKIYLVEMKSIPNGPTGEPETVRGYYAEPQDGKKHPVIMHYFGYDDQNPTSKAYCPSGGSSGEYAEFWLSTRGQVVNNRKAEKREPDGKGDFVNTYGDWFAYNFGQRDAYYYRGAFMDCYQAVRFMATRETSDMSNLFAEGSSQGGALSYATASLSDYPFTAIAPCVAFLGDFPDYFQIVGWPANTAKENQGDMTDDEMYEFLSYFDTKNLVTRLPATTAVLACSGVQDGICPPHTNLAPYNNLPTTDKEYYFYAQMGHSIPNDWPVKMNAFFKARIK